jgi:hypothetical protein
VDPPFKYGYDQEKAQAFMAHLEDRVKAYSIQAEAEKKDPVKRNQWLGAAFATGKILDIIRG